MDSGIMKPNLKTTVILLYVPVMLTVFRYFGWPDFYSGSISNTPGPGPQYYYFISSLVLLGIVPMLIATFGLHLGLRDLGLGLGNLKASLIFSLIGLPVMIILAYLSAKNPSLQAEYPLYRNLLVQKEGLSIYLLIYGLYYIGWEVFFRGFMLFGLRESFGDGHSILIQTIPSCLMHIGKPGAEIFASILAGLVFGWVALKCRSIWPVFISHWGLGAFVDIFIIYG
jgi:membrane protease YdiL (CAAX protease family)